MGCPTTAYAEMGAMTQEKFESLLPVNADGTSLLTNLKHEMVSRPALASSCTRVS
jgi:hypothetical protein